MNTVGFTRHREGASPKYRRMASSRFAARCSTVVGTTPGCTPMAITSVVKNRRTIPSSGSSSSPRCRPTTMSGRTSSSLWYFSSWPYTPETSPLVSTTTRSACPLSRARESSRATPVTTGSRFPCGEVAPTK